MLKLFYFLTAYFPRRMPESVEAFEKFKEVMVHYFNLDDEPPVWIAVVGQIQSHRAQSVRLSYARIANAARRLYINKIANEYKVKAMQELNTRLENAIKAESERMQKEESHDQNGEKQPQENAEPRSSQDQADAQSTQKQDLLPTDPTIGVSSGETGSAP